MDEAASENIMIYLGGSKTSFHCDAEMFGRKICGANVFHRNKNGKIVCNGCGAKYTGEK